MSYTLHTPLKLADYAIGPIQVVKLSSNCYGAVWIRDSDDYAVCATFSYSDGIWTQEQGLQPIFVGDAWYGNDDPLNACKVADDRLLFTYRTSSYLYTRLMDMSTGGITDQGGFDAVGPSSQRGDVAYLDDNKCVLAYRLTSDTALYAKIISITGNNQSGGTAVELDGSAVGKIAVERIASNKFAVLYDDAGGSTANICICTVSGTTITAGTPKIITGETGLKFPNIVSNQDDKFVAVYVDDSNDGKAAAVTVSTRTPTIGTAVVIESDATTNSRGIKVNEDSFLAVYRRAATAGAIIKGDVNWTTRVITMGSSYDWTSDAIGGNLDYGLDFGYMDENLGAIVYQNADDSDKGYIVSILAHLEAPSNVAATEGSSQGEIDISWDSVGGATSYNLYWGTATGVTQGTGTKIEGVTSPYTHTGRDLDTEYFYVVTAVGGVSESADSSEVSSYPLIDTPTNPAAVTAYNGIDVTWTDNSDPIVTYKIYYGTTAGVTTSNPYVEAPDNLLHHTNLGTDGIYYYYRIEAVANENSSALSSEVNAYGIKYSKWRGVLLSLLPKGKAWGK